MKKLILLLLLLLVSQSVMAEWTYVAESYGDKTYVDISTIKKTENGIFKIWDLLDYNEPKPYGKGLKLTSIVTSLEYDCNREVVRHLFYVVYGTHMGLGNSISQEDGLQKWTELAPNSVGRSELKFV